MCFTLKPASKVHFFKMHFLLKRCQNNGLFPSNSIFESESQSCHVVSDSL